MDAGGWALLLLGLGMLLLVLEFFVPSGGTLGVLCALSLLAAIFLGFLDGPWTGIGILVVEGILVPAALAAAVKWWPETPIGRLVLVQRPNSPREVLPESPSFHGYKELAGKRGVAKNLMLPSGSVLIDGSVYDAVSEGMPIEAGQTVIVVGSSTQRLIVRPSQIVAAELVETDTARFASDPLAQHIPDPFAE